MEYVNVNQGFLLKQTTPLPKRWTCGLEINDRYVLAVNDKFRVAQLVFQAVLMP